MSIKLRLNASMILRSSALFLCALLVAVPCTIANGPSTKEMESTANQLFAHMRLGRAKDLLEQIPSGDYNNCSTPLMLGLAYLKLNQYQKATDAFENAKKVPFKSTDYMATKEDLFFQCGYCYYKLGQYGKAADNLNLAGKQGSELLSCAQYRAGETKSCPTISITEYKPSEPYKVAPASSKMPFKETEDYYLQQLSPRIAINLEEIDLSNQFPENGKRDAWEKSITLAQQAENLENSGKFKEAQAKYEKAIALYPYDANTYAALALCKLTVIPLDAKDSSTSLSEVSTTLVKAASLNNSNWKIWNNLACIQLMEEPQQLQDARKSLKVALACSPAPPKIIEEAILHTIKRNVSMDELRDQVKAILGNH